MEPHTIPDTEILQKTGCPSSFNDLEDLIRSTGAVLPSRPFNRLQEAIELTEGFWENTMGFINAEALNAPGLLTSIPVLFEQGRVTLTQRQCLCILANGFLCTFTSRKSSNCQSGCGMPSINFDELYGGCGVFGGDAELKSLIQWVAASRAGRGLHYYPWENRKVASELPAMARLQESGATAGRVASLLMSGLEPGGVYRQIAQSFCL